MKRPSNRRRGAVMAVVIWVMVVILVVALGLAYDTQLNAQAAGNSDARARAYYAALSGIERLSAELDEGGVFYTVPGETWERIDSDEEPLLPEAERFRYIVLASDDCARIDLNEVEEEDLGKVSEVSDEQAQAILEFRGTPRQTGAAAGTSAASTEEVKSFRSVDDLLLLSGFDAGQLYGVTSWAERLSPAERFRQEWAQLSAGTPPVTDTTAAPLLSDLFTVGAAARRIGSDGQPRFSVGSLTREQLSERLEAVAATLQASAGTSGTSPQQGAQGGRGNTSPVAAALRVLDTRDIQNWSQVWGAVNNNREAVRLLADILTLPNDGTTTGAGAPGGGGTGAGGGGDAAGGPGGGGGRGPGGGGAQSPSTLNPQPSTRSSPFRFEIAPSTLNPQPSPRWLPFRFEMASYPSTLNPRPSTHVVLAQGGGTGGQPGGEAEDTTAAEADSEPIRGAINLNTASLGVLLTLPQMTEPIAQAIADHRDTTPMLSRGDLLRIPQVTQAVFNAIVERVTVVSDRYTVRALGVSRRPSLDGALDAQLMGDISVHLTATLDRTTGRCRIVRLRQDN